MTPRLFTLSAETPVELEQATEELARQLESGMESPAVHSAMPCRRIVVADSPLEAARRLREGRSKSVFTGELNPRRPIVFMFSGVGDQYPGMTAGLYRHLPVYRQELDRCLRLLEPEVGMDLRSLLFPPDAPTEGKPGLASLFDQRRSSQEIHQTLAAQPLAFATQYALARTMLSLGIRPRALIGYSLGEYVAGCLAGVFSLDDALRLTALRARLVNAQPEGAMLAVTSAPGPLAPHSQAGVSVAALNGPDLTVLAGPVEAIELLGKRLIDQEIACRRLATSHAFHSPMMDPVVEALRDAFAGVSLSPPLIPFLSNVTGRWIKAHEATDPGYWARHSRETIRFADELTELWRLLEPVPVELGPGQMLINLALRHPAHQSSGQPLALRTLPGVFESRTDLELFLTMLGQLWATGIDIDWSVVTFDEGN
ncbi:acyltransferase domain-containing protein [Nonomuraea sp. NPDC050153]|uniref:acyltransferase domain-containing protein n=1 Tax=Nonomuraea sp. NPDC050153 TaxID=3364359 RepID=UPI0037A8F9C3